MGTDDYKRLEGDVGVLAAKLDGFINEMRAIESNKPKPNVRKVTSKERLLRGAVAGIGYGVGAGVGAGALSALKYYHQPRYKKLLKKYPKLVPAVPLVLASAAGIGTLVNRSINEKIDHYIDTGDTEQFKPPGRRRPGYRMDPNYRKPLTGGSMVAGHDKPR